MEYGHLRPMVTALKDIQRFTCWHLKYGLYDTYPVMVSYFHRPPQHENLYAPKFQITLGQTPFSNHNENPHILFSRGDEFRKNHECALCMLCNVYSW